MIVLVNRKKHQSAKDYKTRIIWFFYIHTCLYIYHFALSVVLCVCLCHLLCFLGPCVVFVILCCLFVHWWLQIRGCHQAYDFIHYCYQIFHRCPFLPYLQHVSTDLPLGIHIWMIDLCYEFDNGRFERKTIKLKLDSELSTFEGTSGRAID